MMRPMPFSQRHQSGVVLVASLLMLLVLTLMALAMFRSFGIQEKIAGNVREKQRALQAAVSTQEYAEWWLANESYAPTAVSLGIAGNATVVCSTLIDANANAGNALLAGQICNNTLQSAFTVNLWQTLWPNSAGTATDIGGVYTPPNMNVPGSIVNGSVSDVYYQRPRFYIYDMGPLLTGNGEVYKVDAYGYGENPTGLAVVESTVAIVSIDHNLSI